MPTYHATAATIYPGYPACGCCVCLGKHCLIGHPGHWHRAPIAFDLSEDDPIWTRDGEPERKQPEPPKEPPPSRRYDLD